MTRPTSMNCRCSTVAALIGTPRCSVEARQHDGAPYEGRPRTTDEAADPPMITDGSGRLVMLKLSASAAPSHMKPSGRRRAA